MKKLMFALFTIVGVNAQGSSQSTNFFDQIKSIAAQATNETDFQEIALNTMDPDHAPLVGLFLKYTSSAFSQRANKDFDIYLNRSLLPLGKTNEIDQDVTFLVMKNALYDPKTQSGILTKVDPVIFTKKLESIITDENPQDFIDYLKQEDFIPKDDVKKFITEGKLAALLFSQADNKEFLSAQDIFDFINSSNLMNDNQVTDAILENMRDSEYYNKNIIAPTTAEGAQKVFDSLMNGLENKIQSLAKNIQPAEFIENLKKQLPALSKSTNQEILNKVNDAIAQVNSDPIQASSLKDKFRRLFTNGIVLGQSSFSDLLDLKQIANNLGITIFNDSLDKELINKFTVSIEARIPANQETVKNILEQKIQSIKKNLLDNMSAAFDLGYHINESLSTIMRGGDYNQYVEYLKRIGEYDISQHIEDYLTQADLLVSSLTDGVKNAQTAGMDVQVIQNDITKSVLQPMIEKLSSALQKIQTNSQFNVTKTFANSSILSFFKELGTMIDYIKAKIDGVMNIKSYADFKNAQTAYEQKVTNIETLTNKLEALNKATQEPATKPINNSRGQQAQTQEQPTQPTDIVEPTQTHQAADVHTQTVDITRPTDIGGNVYHEHATNRDIENEPVRFEPIIAR